MIERFFILYDRGSGLYWTISAIGLSLFLALLIIPFWRYGATALRTRLWRSEFVLAATMASALFSGRWPYLFFRHYFNPDESQQIAGAITLAHDPRFWLSVDGHTAGPVDFYYLGVPAFWGGAINYTSARITALLLMVGVVYFSYRTFRLTLSASTARIAVVPLVLFFGWVTDDDFVEISTEHMPVFLIAAAVYFFLSPILRPTNDRRRRVFWIIAGVCGGLAPWAKLQASVTALGLVLAALIWAYRQPTARDFFPRLSRAWPLLAGMAAPSGFFCIQMMVTRQWSAFYQSYLAANLDYTYRGTAQLYLIGELWGDASGSGFFPVLFLGALGWAATALFSQFWRRENSSKNLGWFWGYAGFSLLTVLSPGRPFLHYLLFLVPPLGLLAGNAWGSFFVSEQPATRERRLGLVYLLSFLAPFVLVRILFPVPLDKNLQAEWQRPLSHPAQLIKPFLRAGDRLAHWGWRPDIYVELQIPQGVRDAHTQREIEDTPFRPYYRARYLADLEKNKPAAFFDAVGPDDFVFLDRKRFGFETFPELKDYVERHYRLIGDEKLGRIFVRNDRFP